MTTRRLLLDDGPGERRGVVLLDGQPERLLIERDGEARPLEAGAHVSARVRRREKGAVLAFLELEGGEPAILSLSGGVRVDEGQALTVEIAAPARPGKAAAVRLSEATKAQPAPSIVDQLKAFAPGVEVERGEAAREAADLAEDLVLQTVFHLGGGASLSIETTRGMTAIDVDLGGADPKGAPRINRLAVAAAARLLRLKGLGGLVVFDLAGDGRGGEALVQAARQAFAPDMPGVAFGPVSRLGVFHLALPWRTAPVAGRLVGADGLPTPRFVAQRLGREIEREAAHAVRVRATCAHEVAEAAAPVLQALLARLGPRVDIRPDPGKGRTVFEARGE